MDISAACAGFCYGVALANDMVRGGSAEYVLVVGVEKLSDFTDLYDRSTAFIFGDGAGAVVIGPSDDPGHRPHRLGLGRRAVGRHPQQHSWIDAARRTTSSGRRSRCRARPSSAGPSGRWRRSPSRRWRRPASAPRSSTRSSRTRPTCGSSTRWSRRCSLPARRPGGPRHRRDRQHLAPRRSRWRWSGCSREGEAPHGGLGPADRLRRRPGLRRPGRHPALATSHPQSRRAPDGNHRAARPPFTLSTHKEQPQHGQQRAGDPQRSRRDRERGDRPARSTRSSRTSRSPTTSTSTRCR